MPRINLRIIPSSLFFFIPLGLGAELVALVAVLNKLSAFYALGALFTGRHLTVMEWVVNLITVAMLPLFVLGYLAIHQYRPLGSLAYAHLYAFDVFMNLGFIIYFIVHWFVVGVKEAGVVSSHGASATPSAPASLSTPTLASSGATIATAASTALPQTAQKALKHVLRSVVEDAKHLNKGAALGQELAVTIVMTVLIVVMRFYFMLVIFGFARYMVQHANLQPHNGEPAGSRAALLQRILLTPFEAFWTSSHHYAPLVSTKVEPDDFEIEDEILSPSSNH